MLGYLVICRTMWRIKCSLRDNNNALNSKCHRVRGVAMKNTFKCKNTNSEAVTRASSDDGKDSTLHSPEEEPTKEHPWAFCAENIKIAPIFLPRTVSKHGTNARIAQQKEDLPSQIEREQQVTIHQDAKHSCDPTHRAGRYRGRLPPPDVTRCLEEIRTSNPAFPARTALSNLQEKSSALCSGDTH